MNFPERVAVHHQRTGRSDARMSAVTGESPAGAADGVVRGAELAIGGMTCASRAS
jgi:hypothetical protein